MARRKGRKHRRNNFFVKRGKWQWNRIILVVLVIALVGYGVNELHQIRLRQQVVQNEPNAKQAFIKQIAPAAQSMQKQHNVLASITIAQAALESDWGTSKLSAKYNNLFGVKSTDTNNSAVLSTKEYVNDQWIVIHGRFAVYDDWAASIQSHTMLMVNGTTDDSSKYATVIQATNYKEAANALQSDGYATDPDYASKLIALIQQYKLYKYDQ